MVLQRYLPVLDWARGYDRTTLTSDLVAAVIVTIMLIPQSLAYAMLAGLPPETGLYASILPILAYALLGTSCSLAMGPVAIVSLMTLAAASKVGAPGSPGFIAAALVLALLSGIFHLLLGVFRLGFLTSLLFYPVISSFMTGAFAHARRKCRANQLADSCHRRPVDGLPVVGARGAEALAAADGPVPLRSRPDGQGWPDSSGCIFDSRRHRLRS
jgi:Sulfate permease family